MTALLQLDPNAQLVGSRPSSAGSMCSPTAWAAEPRAPEAAPVVGAGALQLACVAQNYAWGRLPDSSEVRPSARGGRGGGLGHQGRRQLGE